MKTNKTMLTFVLNLNFFFLNKSEHVNIYVYYKGYSAMYVVQCLYPRQGRDLIINLWQGCCVHNCPEGTSRPVSTTVIGTHKHLLTKGQYSYEYMCIDRYR